MSEAPLGPEHIAEVGRALLLGSSGAFGLLLLVGAGVYLLLCLRSSRNWDGLEQRWRQR